MFREGSNVAISILDNIAVEAAGLAYKALRFAAKCLQRERLWNLCSSSAPRQAPSMAEITELLRLCSIKSISETIDNSGDAQRLAMLFKNSSLIDLQRVCACMKRDPVFLVLPSWEKVSDDGRSMQHLFYFCSDDLFLLVKGSRHDTGLEIDLIERESDSFSSQRATTATQKLTNFLLHFMWSEMALS